MTNTKKFTIGVLAKSANVNIETIRYYQKIGLINEPKKPLSGFRYYPQDAVTRVLFVKKAQEIGFTLKQIQELLSLGDGHCKDIQVLANQKLNEIDSKIKDLRTMRKALSSLVKQCDVSSDGVHCALVESLTKNLHGK